MKSSTANVIALALVLSPCLVQARLGRTATELTASTFEGFVKQYDRLIVDFYDPTDTNWSQDQKDLEEALVKVRKISSSQAPFAKVDVTKEPELAAKFVKNGRYPQIIWFAHGQPSQYHRTLRHADAIVSFVLALDRPSVAKVNSLNDVNAYNLVILAEIPKKSSLYKTIEAVALRHMDQIAFLHMESTKGMISYYKDGKMEQVYEQKSGRSIGFGQDSVDDMDRWVKQQLPLRSEELPLGEDAVDEGAQVIVGKNFEDVVLQKDKDVMLLVHAPWCGHCKALWPKWKQFTQTVSSMAHLVVAQMDGDRNQSPLPNDFAWDAYPTIFYVRAGATAPEVYRGNRTVGSLLGFARQHSSQPWGEIAGSHITDAMYDL